MEWISTEEKRPIYGVPVLIVIDGYPQNVTYFRDGADDTEDWYEPYFFETKEHAVFANKVTHWMPIPEAPKPK